ncbi:MAG: fibronectin type III domain-containing protein, partial [Deltaproteobacteria bacterium]|nr:fibronectin type III domain-containing protein [Deltaproteobacteria bacterium]
MRLGAIGNGLTGIARRRPACPLLGPLALLLAALAWAAPAPAQTAVKLVSNNLQRDANFGRSFGKDLWQPFTTGSSPTGYKLTGVDIALSQVTGNPAYTLSIETHAKGKTVYDFPGTHFATLDNPPGSLVAGLNRHTATGKGIDLAPNTTYRLFLDVTTPAAGHVVKVTSSDAEDAGGLPEWSIAYRAGYRNWWSSENRGGNTWPLKIALHGYVQTLPGKPTSVAATAAANSGALSVSWSPPADLGTGTPKGYEVRYYAGSQDPTDEADWVEDRAGLPDIGPGQVSATVGGLLANTTYRVQVRAVTGAGGGEWSDSASATTGSPPSTNNAPRMLQYNGVWPEGNICEIRDPSTTVEALNYWISGIRTGRTRQLAGRRGEISEWPSVCSTEVSPHFVPLFDDVDGDKLTFFIEPKPVPANVRVAAMWVTQQTSSDNGRAFFRGAAALRWSAMLADVTATDPHGASVTARVMFHVRTFADTATPRFAATVPDQDGSVGEPFSLVLPEATGGDIVSGGLTFSYYYAVSGLPPGLLFDSATRTISGAPTAGGSFAVTYTADDADGYASGFLYPRTVDKTDRASETFKIKIPCDFEVPCHSPPAVEQPPAVRSSAPSFGGAAVAAVKLDRGRAMTPLVLPRATRGDGALTYGLTSSPAGLAGLDFDPVTRRLSGTPGRSGSWTFTYRAEDADADRTDSDAAVLTFEVTVTVTGEAKAAVKRTLSGVATRTLSSALGHIGVRLANVVPAAGLTLAGRRLEFAAPGMGLGAEGAGGGCAWGGLDPQGFGQHGLDGQGFDGHGFDGYGAGDARRDGLGSGGGCAGWSRGIGTEELLRASAFSWLLGAAEGSGGADPAAARWAVWGRGDFSDFSGRPEGMSYDGKARSGWLGVDARKGRWVAGLALSHGVSEADYSYEGGAAGGRLETTLTALYPYGRWTLAEGLEVRG